MGRFQSLQGHKLAADSRRLKVNRLDEAQVLDLRERFWPHMVSCSHLFLYQHVTWASHLTMMKLHFLMYKTGLIMMCFSLGLVSIAPGEHWALPLASL